MKGVLKVLLKELLIFIPIVSLWDESWRELIAVKGYPHKPSLPLLLSLNLPNTGVTVLHNWKPWGL